MYPFSVSAWDVLKYALEQYWKFMSEHWFLGTLMTCMFWSKLFEWLPSFRRQRPAEVNAPEATPTRGGGDDLSSLDEEVRVRLMRAEDERQRQEFARLYAPPPKPEEKPVVVAPSRLDRLKDDVDI